MSAEAGVRRFRPKDEAMNLIIQAQMAAPNQNARNNYERYTTMAKDAARRGDVIEAENYYQHAEHYFRVMKEQDTKR